MYTMFHFISNHDVDPSCELNQELPLKSNRNKTCSVLLRDAQIKRPALKPFFCTTNCKESSNVVPFLACVPLDSEITNGIVLRNDTENGIDYKFTCNRGFVMNGSNHVTCKDGVYNGTTPNCLPKGKKYFHFYRLDEFNNPTARRKCVQFVAFR